MVKCYIEAVCEKPFFLPPPPRLVSIITTSFHNCWCIYRVADFVEYKLCHICFEWSMAQLNIRLAIDLSGKVVAANVIHYRCVCDISFNSSWNAFFSWQWAAMNRKTTLRQQQRYNDDLFQYCDVVFGFNVAAYCYFTVPFSPEYCRCN